MNDFIDPVTSGTTVIDLGGGNRLGEPEPVLGTRGIMDYMQSHWNGAYYDPPVSRWSLARIRHASPYHTSALQRKVNLLLEYTDIADESVLSYEALEGFWYDFFIFGDAAFHALSQTRAGTVRRAEHIHSMHTRRLRNPDEFGLLKSYTGAELFPGESAGRMQVFAPGSVVLMREYDPVQTIYGVPYWLAAVNSILLKESAVLFRRKYYINNAHMGYILYTTLPRASNNSIEAIESALEDAKGINNFKNLLIHEAGGPEKGIQVIPVSEFAAKDEFLNINNVSMQDQLVIHQVSPQLLGIIAQGAGGLGSIEQAEAMFYRNVIRPYRRKMTRLNQFFGTEMLTLRDYDLLPTA